MSKVSSARTATLAIALLLSVLMFISGVPAGAQEAEPTPSPSSSDVDEAAPSESPTPTPEDSASPAASPSESAASPEESPVEPSTPSSSEASSEESGSPTDNTETSSTSSSAAAVPDLCDPYNGGIDCESVIAEIVAMIGASPCSAKIDCDRIIADLNETLDGLVQDPPDPCRPDGGIDCSSLVDRLISILGDPPDVCDPYNGGVDCEELIGRVTGMVTDLVAAPPDPCDPYNGGVDCDELISRLTTIVDEVLANPPDPCNPYSGGIDCEQVIRTLTDRLDELLQNPPDPCDPYNGGIDCQEVIDRVSQALEKDPCDPSAGGIDCNKLVGDVLEVLSRDRCNPDDGGLDCQGIIDSITGAISDACPSGVAACADPYVDFVSRVVDDLYYDICGGDLSACQAKYQEMLDGLLNSVCSSTSSSGTQACVDMVGRIAGEAIDDLYYAACGANDLSACQAKYQEMLDGLLNSVCSSMSGSGTQACLDMVNRIAADAIEKAYRTACPSDVSSDACADRYLATATAIVNGAVDTIYKAVCGTATTSGCLKYYEETVSAAVTGLLNSVCSSSTSSGSQACVDMVNRIATDAIEKAYRTACPSDASSDACADRYLVTATAIVNGAVDTIYKAVCGTATTSGCLKYYDEAVAAAVNGLLNSVCSSTTSSGLAACVDMADAALRQLIATACPGASGLNAEACVELVNGVLNDVIRSLFAVVCPSSGADPASCGDEVLSLLEEAAGNILRTLCPGADSSVCIQAISDELSSLINGVVGEVLNAVCGPLANSVQTCSEAYIAIVQGAVGEVMQEVCPDLACSEGQKEVLVGVVTAFIESVCPFGILTCVGEEQVADTLKEFVDAYCPSLACPNAKVQELMQILTDVAGQVCGPAAFLGCASFFEGVAERLVYLYCPDLSCGDVAKYVQAFVYESLTGMCPNGPGSCVDVLLKECPTPPYIASALEERIPPACGLQMIGQSISDFGVAATVPSPGYGITAHATLLDGYSLFRIETSIHGAVLLVHVGPESVGSDYDATFDPFLPPSPPERLVASVESSSRIALQWGDSSDEEDGFKIFSARESEGPFSHIATVGVDREAFTARDLDPETQYYFRILAYNSAGNSDFSNTTSGTTYSAPPPPRPPSDLGASPVSDRSIALSWVDNSSNEAGFMVERSDAGSMGWVEVARVGTNSKSFTDEGLQSAATYSYRVVAFNEGGHSEPSPIVLTQTQGSTPPPAAPTHLGGVSSDTQVQLNWQDNSLDEDGFSVGRSRTSGGPYELIQRLPANETDFTDSQLGPSTDYYYVVSAFSHAGSSPSAESRLRTRSSPDSSTPPGPPAGLSARAVSGNEVSLSWSDGSDDESGFALERSLSDSSGFSELFRLGPNATSANDGTTSPGVTYYYRLKAFNAAGVSNSSNVAVVSTPANSQGSSPPSSPSGLTAGAVSSSSVELGWGDTSHSEEGFVVQRALSSTGPFSQVASLGANVTRYLDGGLTADRSYYYRVQARNTAGTSAFSNVASARTPSAAASGPTGPSGLAATRSAPDEITLTWTDNAGDETQFKIERASAPGAFVQIGTVGANQVRFLDYEAMDSSAYRYRVRASNAAGESAYSNEAVVDGGAHWGVDQPGYDDGGGGGDRLACGEPGLNLKPWKIYSEGVNWTFRRDSVPEYLRNRMGLVLDRLREGGSNIGDVQTNCKGIGDFIDDYPLFTFIDNDGRVTNVNGPDGSDAECTERDRFSAVDFGPLPEKGSSTTLGFSCTTDKADPPLERNRVLETDIRINANEEEVEFFVTNSLPPSCSGLRDLEGVMTHERGHSAGMAHVSEEEFPNLTMSKLLDATCNRGLRNLGKGDIRALRRLYG